MMKELIAYIIVCLAALNVFSIEELIFRKMNLDCIFQTTTLVNIPGTSISDCASYCTRFSQNCARFRWNSTNRVCLFSSNDFIIGSFSMTSYNSVSFSTSLQECYDVGYDYDRKTNTCLNLITSSGSTWFEARTRCQQDGGDLISITSTEKFEFVYHYMQCVAGQDRAWIGLNANRWLTGSTFRNIFGKAVQINHYDKYYPDDPGPFCGTIGSEYAIMDFSCTYNKFSNFICEIILKK